MGGTGVMRWLIDGYNVMHAGGRLGPKLGREGFRRARRRFLNELAATLPPEEAEQTTVVFDASAPPGDFKVDERFRGLHVLFALGDENADARIEQLIAAHSTPRTLSVVSSDRRIRQAAQRRRATVLTAEDYWNRLDDLKERAARPHEREPDRPEEPAAGRAVLDPAHWREVFRDLDDSAEIRQALAPDAALLTDQEIADLERQIDREP
ncbi:MAG TPA: NYN domain-containing protein [Isosphaeraceae bacterium]|nr:NYN domain-containing protein [Isosphaeraceae bacterium]